MNRPRHLAAVFSDWHINSYYRFNEDGQRLPNCLRVLFDIGAFCRSKGITTILFGGDWYDTQKVLATQVVNETVDMILEFQATYPEIQIVAISGNHDHSTKNLIGAKAVSALKHIQSICSNFHLIDDIYYDSIDGVVIHGIPYYEYDEHFNEVLQATSDGVKEIDPDGEFKHILLIHQTPAGLGNEMIPTNTNPKDEAYEVFDHVFCGHIHMNLSITPKFTVIGNPLHRDAADEGYPKGFLVMNLLAPENGYKFIQLKGYPEFITLMEGEETDDTFNYILRKQDEENLIISESADIENFDTSLKSEDLLTNYWQEVDGKDEELLGIGLSFLPSFVSKEVADANKSA